MAKGPLDKLAEDISEGKSIWSHSVFSDADADGVPNFSDCRPLNPKKQESSFREVQDKYLKGTKLLRVRGEQQMHYAWSVLFSPQYLMSRSWSQVSKEYDRLKNALSELGYDVDATKDELRAKWERVHSG